MRQVTPEHSADPGPRQNAGWRNAAATTARAVGAAALLNEHNAMDVCHSRRSRESTAAKQCEQQPQQPRAAAAARARHLNFRRTSGPCQFPGQCQAAAPTPSRAMVAATGHQPAHWHGRGSKGAAGMLHQPTSVWLGQARRPRPHASPAAAAAPELRSSWLLQRPEHAGWARPTSECGWLPHGSPHNRVEKARAGLTSTLTCN